MRLILIMSVLLLCIPLVDAYELQLSLELVGNATEYNQSETIQYKVMVKNEEGTSKEEITYVMGHWVEDENKTEVKQRQESSRTLKKSKTETFRWTPSDPGTYNICAKIQDVFNETNAGNNEQCVAVAIHGSKEEEQKNESEMDPKPDNQSEKKEEIQTTEKSTIVLGKTTPGTVSFGDVFFIEVEGKREDTNKYTIQISVESADGKKVSEETKMQIKKKQEEFSFLIPVQLKQICSSEGTYFLRVQGLEIETSKEIIIQQNPKLCKKQNIEVEQTETPKENKEESSSLPSVEIITPKTAYVDEPFTVFVILRKPDEWDGNYSVHGYGYDKERPVTLGLSGEKWKSTWTANKKGVLLEDEVTIVTLQSKFEEMPPGTYPYKVVVKGKKKYEQEKTIQLLPKREQEKKAEPNNQTKVDSQNKTQNRVTGQAIHAKKENKTGSRWKKFIFWNKKQ